MSYRAEAIVVTASLVVASACGSPPASPSTPPISIAIAAPKALSPVNNQQVETRPRLSVEAAVGGNPSAIFTYRFDVSPSPEFTDRVVSTTMSYGYPTPPGFSIDTLLAVELSLDTRYYWRAQAIDVANGVPSPFSSTSTFSTFGPRPGFSMLHVSPSGCNSDIGVTFDGTLTSDGTVARFAVPDGFGGTPPLTIELSRASTGWSGRIFGDGVGRDANEMEILPGSAGAALPVQARDASDRWSGRFDGTVAIRNRYQDGNVCSGTFTWVIVPPPGRI